MLILQAAQQLPPINVTVQTPPGMPEWLKVLIAAVVGFAAGIALEFVKPWLEKVRVRENIERHLTLELIGSLLRLEWAIRFLEEDGPNRVLFANGALATIRQLRYDSFIEKHTTVVYDIDADEKIALFYESVALLIRFLNQPDADVPTLIERAADCSDTGRSYLVEHNINRKYADNESCPTPDEPEGATGFQRRMSLKEG